MSGTPTPTPGAGPAPCLYYRHPPARGAAGRCIGRIDLPVDPRKARRLAHRIRQQARRRSLPQQVVTSPLERCAAVGRWLRRWGWTHRIDAALLEADFGHWDGLAWRVIGREAVDAWCADFADHRPGGGESLRALALRVAEWQPRPGESIVVGHAGWITMRRWLHEAGDRLPTASTWPAPLAPGAHWQADPARRSRTPPEAPDA